MCRATSSQPRRLPATWMRPASAPHSVASRSHSRAPKRCWSSARSRASKAEAAVPSANPKALTAARSSRAAGELLAPRLQGLEQRVVRLLEGDHALLLELGDQGLDRNAELGQAAEQRPRAIEVTVDRGLEAAVVVERGQRGR